MKFLRLVQSGYENYSGPIGAYEFIDGVSAHQIPRNDRDRLSTAFQFVEYEAEEDEHLPAGVAHRLIALSAMRADVNVKLDRQTEDEKDAEQVTIVKNSVPERTLYDRADLERIADKRGISGLRDISEPWGVKNRQIVTLISMILHAQETWLAERDAARDARRAGEKTFEKDIVAKVIDEQKISLPADDEKEIVEKTDDLLIEAAAEADAEAKALALAAATGDMSAALNGE